MNIKMVPEHLDLENAHYCPPDPTYEVVKCIEAHGLYGNGYRCQAIQYLFRADRKGGTRDLKAAIWWIEREIRRCEAGDHPGDPIVTPDAPSEPREQPDDGE